MDQNLDDALTLLVACIPEERRTAPSLRAHKLRDSNHCTPSSFEDELQHWLCAEESERWILALRAAFGAADGDKPLDSSIATLAEELWLWIPRPLHGVLRELLAERRGEPVSEIGGFAQIDLRQRE